MTGPLAAFAGDDPPEWPAAVGPKVLVYHPLERQQGIGLGAALAALGLPGLWVASPVPDAIPLPPAIALQPAGIDMAAALADASLLVHRGGHYSALDALAAGVPQLLLPDTLEAEFNARALIDAGVAERAEPAALEHQIAALLRPDHPVRLAAAQAGAAHAGHDRQAATTLLAAQIVAHLRRDGTG